MLEVKDEGEAQLIQQLHELAGMLAEGPDEEGAAGTGVLLDRGHEVGGRAAGCTGRTTGCLTTPAVVLAAPRQWHQAFLAARAQTCIGDRHCACHGLLY